MDIVVDSIGKLVVQNGLARIELLTAKTLAAEGETPDFEVGARLAMSLDSFLKFHQGVSAVVAQLESKGVIQKRNASVGNKPSKKPN